MPRRLSEPDPPLADDLIRLEPLRRAQQAEFGWVVAGDPDILRFTFLPSETGDGFLERWLGRYEDGWREGTSAGFGVRDESGAMVGFAAIVHLDLDRAQGELGYMLAPAARGRGLATRSIELLTRWSFDALALERLELRIDTENRGSERVAEKAGYRRDGVLRSLYFKEGRRTDTGIWSRLAQD